MKPAFIWWYGRKNGQQRLATLRSGKRGYGRLIHMVNYWPDSGSSMEAAYRMFQAAAEREGYTIVGTDRDEE